MSLASLKTKIRSIPDFPKKGILLRDITPLLKDPKTFREVIARLAKAVKKAKASGCRVLSICNVPGSSLVRESHAVLFSDAGPDIGVASTKAFTAQLMAFALLAFCLDHQRPVNEGAQFVLRKIA